MKTGKETGTSNKAIRILITFFTIMFVFAIISRGADSIIVPRVTVAALKGGNLVHYIVGDGEVISSEREYESLLENIKVDKIHVRMGDKVTVNTPILTYNMDDIEEQLDNLEDSAAKIKLQIEEKKLDSGTEIPEGEMTVVELAYHKALDDYNTAKEEYEELKETQSDEKQDTIEDLYEEKADECTQMEATVSQKKSNLELAQKSLKNEETKEKAELDGLQEKMDQNKKIMDEITEGTYDKSDIEKQKKAALNQAEQDYQDAVNEMDNWESIYSYEYRLRLYNEAKEEYLSLKENYEADVEEEVQKVYDAAEEAFEEYQNQYNTSSGDYAVLSDEKQAEITELNEELAQLEVKINDAETVMKKIKNGTFGLDDLRKEQKRALSDAKATLKEKRYAVQSARIALNEELETSSNAQNAAITEEKRSQILAQLEIESLQIDLDSITEDESELKQLIEAKGIFYAEKAGTVEDIDTEEGKVTQTGDTVTIGSEECVYQAEIAEGDGKYLEVGDSIQLTKQGKNDQKEGEITALEEVKNEEDETILLLTASTPEGMELSSGDELSFSVQETSEMYENCISIQAVRGGGNDTYVYLAVSKDTMLGQELVVEKRVISLWNKDSMTAVLNDIGTLTSTDNIIVSSNKTISEGDRIRLAE